MHSSKHCLSGCSKKSLDTARAQKKTQAVMKVALSKIKKNLQGTNSGGDEAENQINDLEHKEEKSIKSQHQEEKRIFKKEDRIRSQKNEERLRNLQDILKRSNIRIIGVPEGEEEEQNIENLFEQVMKENFLTLAKEIDFQEVQEAQRVPKKLDPRRNTPRHIIIKLPKSEDKERIS